MTIITARRAALVALVVLAGGTAYVLRGVTAWEPSPRANFWILTAAAGAALWYGWLTYLSLRADQTPTLVARFQNDSTIVQNFGRGAALNVSITDDDGNRLVRVPDLAPNESHSISSRIDWTVTEARYVFSQDVRAKWFGTKALGQGITSAANLPVANVFLGRVFNPPSDATRAAAVRSAVDHWVQLNRSWDPRNWVRRLAYFARKYMAERRIVTLIRAAIRDGRLTSPFSASDVSTATDLDRIVADRFLPNHRVGNPGDEREFFVEESSGRFRLKRRNE